MAKIRPTPTTDGLKYGFRRMTYNAQLAAGVVVRLRVKGNDFSIREAMKIGGLILTRNFDDFFFKKTTDLKDDDLHVSDYDLANATPPWTPDQNLKLDRIMRDRINKIAGHIVSSAPDVFHDKEACEVILKVLPNVINFLNACPQKCRPPTASKYQPRLNVELAALKCGLHMK